MSNQPKPNKRYSTLYLNHFKEGLDRPPVEDLYRGTLSWNVTDDNALVAHGDDWSFVSPPGMWQSVFVVLDEEEAQDEEAQ